MKTFGVIIILGFILISIVQSPSFAQNCSVKITGTSCSADTLNGKDSLQAIFSEGTLSSLVWMYGGNDSEESGDVFYSSTKTVAGANGRGNAPNQFAYPKGVFVDAAGNIYVADGNNHRVQKWAPVATSGITVAGGNGQGSAANQLSFPEGVFVDTAGNIYVADASNHRIQKWAPGAAQGVTVAGGNGEGSATNQLN